MPYTATVSVTATLGVNSVDSPFIIEWLKHRADQSYTAAPGYDNTSSRKLREAARLVAEAYGKESMLIAHHCPWCGGYPNECRCKLTPNQRVVASLKR